LAAQPGYPNRPVRIIVPYGPGGVADTTMRIIADKLTQKLGKRTSALPAVPTVGESGLPDYVVESWNALSGPGGLPDDIVKFLNRAVNDVLNLPEVKEKAMLSGMDARGTTPEEMQARMKADIAKWAAVIEKAGIERQ